ncbi:class I SAM-dependent methyltransferase [Bradyrhizobium sp. SYSU BS000235]|uniref:class I SAM-dependent methyltransferase n=1 Tax=Bradyrhizobium sp. SYSU BS000235 TaxID=3411332 RepID=UPI003C77D99F
MTSNIEPLHDSRPPVAEFERRAIPCVVCENTKWNFKFRKQGYDFVQCAECGLVRLDPLPSAEALNHHYEMRAKAGNYEPGKAIERLRVSEQIFASIEKITNSKPKKIFDIGCFDGQLLDVAKGHGWETWGLELQGSAAEVARKKHGDHIFIGTVEEWGIRHPGYFDVITAIAVIEHLTDPRKLLDLAWSCLKPGGLFVIQTPNNDSIPSKIMGRYWPCIAAPEHVFYFSDKTLEKMSTHAGFDSLFWSSHWKSLRLGYVINQLQYFGPELGRVVSRLEPFCPNWILSRQLPVYGGEMLFFARKPYSSDHSSAG